MRILPFFLLVALVLSGVPVLAQGDQKAQSGAEEAKTEKAETAEKAEELPEKELRVQLAKKMHEIRPTRLQIEAAVQQAAAGLPEKERAAFQKRMIGAIDLEKIESISIGAMVEVFSLAELERMVAYYLTPEAQSISAKMPIYQGIVQPEIIRMLDNAMLQMRTGVMEEKSAPAPAEKSDKKAP